MKNGRNEWGVGYSLITFLEKILKAHTNVVVLNRHDDIVFEITRNSQADQLTIVCIKAYTASLELVMRVVEAFPDVDIIFIGGKWAGYTDDAYEFCQGRQIGIYNAGTLAGALRKDEYWKYGKDAAKGNQGAGKQA